MGNQNKSCKRELSFLIKRDRLNLLFVSGHYTLRDILVRLEFLKALIVDFPDDDATFQRLI